MEANDNCKLQIYDGTIPGSADDGIGNATLLVELSADGAGGGLQFASAASEGSLEKSDSQDWQGEIEADGQATFYRLVADGDSGGESTTQPRIQGKVDIAGADLNLSSVNLSQGATMTLSYYVVNLPTAG